MDIEDLITATKVAGALIGGVLGVIGVVFNFKKSNGKISNWGTAVIAGIVLSAIVGIITSITEGRKARFEALQQGARTEQLLMELSRTVQPINDLRVYHRLILPSEAPFVRNYLKRLSKLVNTVSPIGEGGSPFRRSKLDPNLLFMLADGSIRVEINSKSPFWPKENEDEGKLWLWAKSYGFAVHIRKTPIEPEQFNPVIGSDTSEGGSDWIALPNLVNDNSLRYESRHGSLEINGSHTYDKNLWHSNGKITSFVDLYGAQLFLVPSPTQSVSWHSDGTLALSPDHVAEAIIPKHIHLSFGSGRGVWVNSATLTRAHSHGQITYSIILPKTEAGLERLAAEKE